MSWSAVAQIESGRRKDVRLTTLSALAEALGVSVDYLIGNPAAPPLLEHRVLTYESDEEFVAGAIPFIDEGIERSHCLLAVMTPPRSGLLRDTLEDRSEHVEFADWADWYRSPSAAMNAYREFVNRKLEGGAPWIRIVGEAAWDGETDAKLAEWTRYESLVNLAFASSPTTIVCTYDERSFATEGVADALRTHPTVARGAETSSSPTYQQTEDFLI